MWLILVIFSAICLGFYNVFQKIALKENALLPVLFFSILCSAILIAPFQFLSVSLPTVMQNSPFFVPDVSLKTHFFILIKSMIVLLSWILGYAGMKHLPLTIVSPIKATQPMWTVIGALVIFSERLNFNQTVGVIIVLLAFYCFSVIGKKEGIKFTNNKWIFCLIVSTLVGASSGLYDKFLMHNFNRIAVQVYFTYYQVIIMGILLLILWYPKRKSKPFHWQWSVALISLFITCSDFLYFYALSFPDALISIISPIRRSGIIIPFIIGALFFKEKHRIQKLICIIAILIGVSFLFFGSK